MNGIDTYIDQQDPAIQPRLRAIRDTIREAIPEAEERISWGMPTFWRGRNLIHFAPARAHIGVYPGPEAIEHFAPRMTAYKTGRGTIRLPNRGELPLELIAEIARWCLKQSRI